MPVSAVSTIDGHILFDHQQKHGCTVLASGKGDSMKLPLYVLLSVSVHTSAPLFRVGPFIVVSQAVPAGDIQPAILHTAEYVASLFTMDAL